MSVCLFLIQFSADLDEICHVASSCRPVGQCDTIQYSTINRMQRTHGHGRDCRS